MRRLMFWKKSPTEPTRAQLRTRNFDWQNAKRAAKRGAYLGLICAIAMGYYHKDSLSESGYLMTARTGLALADVHITGRNYTSLDDIKQAINAPYGAPLLALPLHEIQHSLTQLGWVKSVRVSRQFPDALKIDLTERRPLALLQTTGGHRLIDETGHLIFGAQASAFSHLPVVSGEGAADQAKHIIEALRTEPDLYADVWAIQRVSNRRWDVHLRTGMEIRLPEKDAALAWSKLAILDRDTMIMKRDLATIDLRVSGQLIVEPNLPLSKKGQKT